MNEISALLEVANVGCVGSGLEFDPAFFEVHTDVDFHLFENWSVDFHPYFFQRCVAVLWDCDFAELDVASGDLVGG